MVPHKRGRLDNALIIATLLALSTSLNVFGRGIYQEPRAFVEEVFAGAPPRPNKLWIKGELKRQVKQVLGHDLGILRLRYWGEPGRTVWILEEIGKEKPITTGIVVRGQKIERVRVLIFRESRGWEVRYPFFTDQFKDIRLTPELGLDRPVDGISGATLSVRALKKLASVALLLHRYSAYAD